MKAVHTGPSERAGHIAGPVLVGPELHGAARHPADHPRPDDRGTGPRRTGDRDRSVPGRPRGRNQRAVVVLVGVLAAGARGDRRVPDPPPESRGLNLHDRACSGPSPTPATASRSDALVSVLRCA